MSRRSWVTAAAAVLTAIATASGFAYHHDALASSDVDDHLWAALAWSLGIGFAVATTALLAGGLASRSRPLAALTWLVLAGVLTAAGWQARAESARPPTSLTTDSDVPSLLMLLLSLECWAAALAVAVVGPVLVLSPLPREAALTSPPR